MKKLVLFSCLVLLAGGFVFSQDFTNQEKWYTYNDKDNGGTYTVVHMTGKVTTKYPYGFVGFGYRPVGADLDKVRNAKGITFKVIGDGKKYRFRGETTDIKDYNVHGKEFPTRAGQVMEVSIPWNYMLQESWGAKVGFVKGHLWQLSFQTVGQPYESVDLKVFDIKLME